MELLTTAQRAALEENGRMMAAGGVSGTLRPVVKLFTPDAGATWLLAWLGDGDMAWGLCDPGLGAPQIGSVSLGRLAALRGPLGLPVERDLDFTPEMTLADYASRALVAGRVEA